MTSYEKEQLQKEKLKIQRKRDLFLAFTRVEASVKEEVDLIDRVQSSTLAIERKQTEIQSLRIVKLLS